MGILGVFCVLEVICLFAIRRWRSNIKSDIVAQFNLDKILRNGESSGEQQNDDNNIDFEKTPFL